MPDNSQTSSAMGRRQRHVTRRMLHALLCGRSRCRLSRFLSYPSKRDPQDAFDYLSSRVQGHYHARGRQSSLAHASKTCNKRSNTGRRRIIEFSRKGKLFHCCREEAITPLVSRGGAKKRGSGHRTKISSCQRCKWWSSSGQTRSARRPTTSTSCRVRMR